ncbi:uncharacterized protein BCR38DRAFT_459253 [Pseudomassariella vexata]|uniref:Ataxin-10 homolog n=1 Tax=Pseudomassariella vexata TaxID=1141098 RepID=A0A1Y2DPZ0_9PEZI|nr:uncharacterized protein BCR38DRAFT_459253 [Pseudomassariella vexata]ORY61348.1 hypothetical protein BCR38DRAFT_459253 [Pseudomassariella vexata]
MASNGVPDGDPPHAWKQDSIEERNFAAGLMCLEGHYTQSPVMGPLSMAKVMSVISKTLEKTHTFKDVREVLSRNLRIWIWLRRAISATICDLNEKALGVRSEPRVPTKFTDITTPEVTTLIIKNYAFLKEALQMLNKLMHIARNLLVTTDPEIPQELSAAIVFDHEVYEAICICVNVTSKGIDGEMPEDDASRAKLNEITELFKKVLVTSLQQAHNWIAKNDRNKMQFWFRVLIEPPDVDVNPSLEDRHESVLDSIGPKVFPLRFEIANWLKRNSKMCDAATAICKEYWDAEDDQHRNQWLPRHWHLAWNYTPPEVWAWKLHGYDETVESISKWDPEEPDKFEQDRAYGRVSHELDKWWEDAHIPSMNDRHLEMPPLEGVPERIKLCEANLMQRYAAAEPSEEQEEEDAHHVDGPTSNPEWQGHGQAGQATSGYAPDYDEYEEDQDDDDSYGEGPMTGLLTEVPNILDPKQIEALHMIVKSCILDSAGSGPTRFGENLQQTRCRMLLATDCGKNLLREMLVFIAVWEKDEQSLIFQISSQIVQAIHESSLIPYAWNALRSPKDIISPAQTVLLRLITYLSRTAFLPPKDYNPSASANDASQPPSEDLRLAKMLNFLYTIFRSRIVPECVALMQIQGEVRKGQLDPADFPVDNWDLERAKDGLVQYLDFLYTIADIHPLRQHLIEYEAVYELLKLLEGLDVGVEKIPFAGARPAPPTPFNTTSNPHQPSAANPPPPPPPPPLSEPPHEFPWSGIKGQVLSILAALLQPPPGQSSPGNPTVQYQIVQHNGIVALLNCCLYDDNNRFCRERVQLCLKWLMDGSPDASAFLQNLVSANPGPMVRPPPGSGTITQSVRVDGVPAEVRVQVRSSSAPAGDDGGGAPLVSSNVVTAGRSRSEELVNDIMALADEAGKLAMGPEGDETEDDFM